MTDVFHEKSGVYTGELKKAFQWVEDEGVGKPMVQGEALMVRNGFLLKRAEGVSKLRSEGTNVLDDDAPAERFPPGFTPEPPIPNPDTGLYDGWCIVGDTKASQEVDGTGLYEGHDDMYRAFHFFMEQTVDPVTGRKKYRQDRQTRKWNIEDGHYRYSDGYFVPTGEPDETMPRDMQKLRAYMKKNDLAGVIFEHPSGSSGQVLLEKIPQKETAAPARKPGRPRKVPEEASAPEEVSP